MATRTGRYSVSAKKNGASHLFPGEHPTKDHLERYLLEVLDPKEVTEIEEHLFVCQVCIENAFELKDYVRAIRGALEAD